MFHFSIFLFSVLNFKSKCKSIKTLDELVFQTQSPSKHFPFFKLAILIFACVGTLVSFLWDNIPFSSVLRYFFYLMVLFLAFNCHTGKLFYILGLDPTYKM